MLVVEAAEAGLRLDVFLTQRLPDCTRSQIQKLIRTGNVQVGLQAARKVGQEITPGERILVRREKESLHASPEDLALDIVYEDEDLVAVNKPAGMVVHLGAGVTHGTLVNALLYHVRRLSGLGGTERPGIVHRLDKNTSGLILVAKNDLAHRSLSDAFKSRAIRKTYIALVHGRVNKDEAEISAAVGRDPVRRSRMKAGGPRSREARTRYRVLRRYAGFTLLELKPETGRTHQIRVHLASVGHPVVGDALYGAPARLRIAGKEQSTLPRTFLHASKLEFNHPRTGGSMVLNASPPQELEEFLHLLDPNRERERAEAEPLLMRGADDTN
ncbi:MAG TPA: RluA family pseudouridine synthase [Terriglobia bacterium]|nr:RluA family pseudouridine synthase [Terriglobia bacterium]